MFSITINRTTVERTEAGSFWLATPRREVFITREAQDFWWPQRDKVASVAGSTVWLGFGWNLTHSRKTTAQGLEAH